MRYVGLLRAVNVGGTGKLRMADLRQVCAEIGLKAVQTEGASGNVILDSDLPEARIIASLRSRLGARMDKPPSVFLRTAAQMRAVLDANPFGQALGNQVAVIFLDAPPDPAPVLKGQTDEQIEPGAQEYYVWYPSGMGRSKLRIHQAEAGTARNLNTVARLVEVLEDQAPRPSTTP